jgi:ketosteroid isomerase-like protein
MGMRIARDLSVSQRRRKKPMQTRVRPLLVIVSVLLLLLVSAGRPIRASASTDAEFIGFLEEAWVNAILQKNVNVLDRVMANDFTGVSPNGQRYTKEEAIADVRSGAYTVESMKVDNVKVRIVGDMAIVTYYQNEKSKFGDEDCSGRYVFTDVWVNRNDDWQVIASHGTPVVLP